jgi:spore coat polysaccharide biosynthesis protein SpsF
MLEFQLERLCQVPDTQVCVATTTNGTDEPIVNLCKELGIPFHRGPEQDVLARYVGAAAAMKADPVVRVTSDCPLIDPDVVKKVIDLYEECDGDYVSNTLTRTFPRGLDTEVVGRRALDVADREATRAEDREHVTSFLYRQPERFRLCGLEHTTDLQKHRWTVDTAEDYRFVGEVIRAVYPQNPSFRMADVLDLLERRPELVRINAAVAQREIATQ